MTTRPMHPRRRAGDRRASAGRRAVACLGLLGGLAADGPARAGLSLDEALQRSTAMARGGPTPIGLDASSGPPVRRAVVALGGLGGDVPPLLGPVVDGDGGLAFADGIDGPFGARARFGLAFEKGERRALGFDGSRLDVGFGVGRLYASVERRHWGPGWTGGLILDGAARAVPAVGWRKDEPTAFATPWLAWLGPWQMDVFAGQLSHRDGPARPKLLGARVQAMPLPGLEIGLSRTLQWGGEGRPETLGSLARALLGRDNSDTPTQRASEPGNQLAGGDVRWQLRFGERAAASVYAETIGEDEASGLPSKRLLTVGLDAAWTAGAAHLRAFAERADVTLAPGIGNVPPGGAYRHSIYSDGYTHLGSPLGHPAGGNVRIWSAGVYARTGARPGDWSGALLAHRGRALPTAQLHPGGGRLGGLQGELGWQVDARSRVGVSLVRWRSPESASAGTGEHVVRGQVWWAHDLP